MIRTIIAGEIPLYLSGLQSALTLHSNIDVLSIVTDDGVLLREVALKQPCIVLLDRTMRNAVSTAKAIPQQCPTTKVVLLFVSEDDEGRDVFTESGAAGFVGKQATLDELVTAMERAAGTSFFPTTTSAPAKSSIKAGRIAHQLTSQERRILGHLEGGLANKQIAARLGIEVATVKTHVHRILDKLGVSNRVEAAVLIRRLERLHMPRPVPGIDAE